jgi:HSP20 family protein
MPTQELELQQKREVEKKEEATAAARTFLAMADIFETDDALTVILEMPGAKKDNIDVGIENDVLTVRGRIEFSNYQGLRPIYTEYNVGNYRRSFQLSNKIDQSRISAQLEDGVLTLTLPKAEEAKPRRIAVN